MDSSDERKPVDGAQSGPDAGSNDEKQKLSRREWFVELGGTAAALGLSGPALEKVRALADAGAAASSQPLPSGLYEPSYDLLTQAMRSDSRFHAIPAGTQTDYARPSHGPYSPQFFSHEEFETVRKLVRVMLDAGSSAGEAAQSEQRRRVSEDICEWIDLVLFREPEVRDAAKKISAQHRELAVHYYGDELARRIETENHQKDWREGMEWLAAESHHRYGKPPSALEDGELAAILEQIESKGTEAAPAGAGSHFFQLLKGSVIEAYYTSKAGLAELDANRHSFHAESPGCNKKNFPA